jgi:HEAT repeat protein
MTISSAIEDFRAAAIAKRDFAEPSRDEELHRVMASALSFLQSQGQSGREAFSQLLADESAHVRIWVAAQLLAEGDESALPVLRELVAGSGLLGFEAEITIREYEARRLRSPFTHNAA